jgi:hypothetical protein
MFNVSKFQGFKVSRFRLQVHKFEEKRSLRMNYRKNWEILELVRKVHGLTGLRVDKL